MPENTQTEIEGREFESWHWQGFILIGSRLKTTHFFILLLYTFTYWYCPMFT